MPSAPARSRKETSPLAATRRCGRAPGTAVVRLLRFAAPARTARLAWHTHTTNCRSHLAARLLQRTRASQLRRDPSNRRGDFYRELRSYLESEPADGQKPLVVRVRATSSQTWAPVRSCAQPGRMEMNAGVKAEQRTPLVLRTRCLVGSQA